MTIEELINVAYLYHVSGLPLPVDVQGALLRKGVSPSALMDSFEAAKISSPPIRGNGRFLDSSPPIRGEGGDLVTTVDGWR